MEAKLTKTNLLQLNAPFHQKPSCKEVDQISSQKSKMHSISGVTMRISFGRSQDNYVIMRQDGAKHYKVKIDEANLFVRKMTVSDNVVGAIENPSHVSIQQSYFESLSRNSWTTKLETRRYFHKGTHSKTYYCNVCKCRFHWNQHWESIFISKVWSKWDNCLPQWICNCWYANVDQRR